ncbi:hypothetical protein PGT21_015522 [Puccinia graminis f. sp. tritici]|uniref:Uncharacterized protein n=1 Tax=Puccinia graminis f. sp. tritici TaxID=56615 RepID=A0A5B0NH85_PUCGR|nr:hypothetical protein PGT21_015522 [Puccinia graminis f. sp. tritici]KAA1087964.1 hypothetical protein PGTUg99_010891 [Puccinia graminis f. sp. tritici]
MNFFMLLWAHLAVSLALVNAAPYERMPLPGPYSCVGQAGVRACCPRGQKC